jgi:hypothetical protein
MAGAAQAADGSPSMAETRKWLGRAGNSSDSLAQDMSAPAKTPSRSRTSTFVSKFRFSYPLFIAALSPSGTLLPVSLQMIMNR